MQLCRVITARAWCRSDFQAIIEQISSELKCILPIGSARSYNSILNHCAGYEPGMVARAIDFMVEAGKAGAERQQQDCRENAVAAKRRYKHTPTLPTLFPWPLLSFF